MQTECLYWEDELQLLAIGMDDGKVHTLKVSKDLNFMQYEEVTTVKAHSARVMGLAIETRRGYFYSVGEDKKFKIFDLNSGENVIGTPPPRSPQTCSRARASSRTSSLTSPTPASS